MEHSHLHSETSGERRRTVLVVDDEDMVRMVAAELLRHLGYEVEMASSGEEAVERIQSGARPSCILLDVIMPGIGGAEALRRIHSIAPDLRVVVSSGFAEQDSATSFTDDGAAGFISKPYRMEALGSKLKEVLG